MEVSFLLKDLEGKNIADYSSVYQINGMGEIRVTNVFEMTADELSEIPRFGMNMHMPRDFEVFTWLGRGPHESYWDRKSGARLGVYHQEVSELFHPYIRPQETGNRTDIRRFLERL